MKHIIIMLRGLLVFGAISLVFSLYLFGLGYFFGVERVVEFTLVTGLIGSFLYLVYIAGDVFE